MAEYSYTLKINSALPQDISSLTIDCFPADATPQQPDSFGSVTPTQWTPAQVPLVTGDQRDRLTWNIDCFLSEPDSLKLAALFKWQQNRLLNQLDGRLTLTDEYYYLEPEATPTRSYVSTLTTGDGQSYGYPIVDVVISRPTRILAGRASDGTQWYRCTFQVQETRSS